MMENLKETVDAVVNSRYPEMNKEGRELLAQVLIRKELEKGEMLLNEGQISRQMVFVGKGMLRQFYYKNGERCHRTLLIRRMYSDVHRKFIETRTHPLDGRSVGTGSDIHASLRHPAKVTGTVQRDQCFLSQSAGIFTHCITNKS